MWQRSKPYWLIAPATIFMLFLFIGGMWEGLMQSVGLFPADDLSQFSGEAYKRLFNREDFWTSLWLTFRIAFLSTLFAGIMGMVITVLLVMLKRKGFIRSTSSWLRLIQLPLTIPHFVGAYFIVMMFMQSGWLARFFFLIGWIEEPGQFPVFINDPNGWGIILTYTWKEVPFIVLMLYPVFIRIQDKWREVAQVFGAGEKEFFNQVTIPLVLPAWLHACLIVFAFTFSAFEVPFLLGMTYPQMLPVLSYELYTNGELSDRPEALAINVILALLTAILGLIAYRFGQRFRSDRWNGG